MSIKGTLTEKNLLKAFAGESQAKNRYQLFASQAKKEGLIAIANIFSETSEHEQSHAKSFFKFMEGGDVEITATYPAGYVGTTLENLKAAAMGENEEWTKLYSHFANVAKEEGFGKIAARFHLIATIEKLHEKRFLQLFSQLQSGKMFEREEAVLWKCLKCGYVHEGKQALDMCPACDHPKGYFMAIENSY